MSLPASLTVKAPSASAVPPATDSAQLAKRKAIVGAAVRVFLESGFEKASMDAVAARAGVSKATLYRHFTSKDLLFRDIVTSRCQAMEPMIADAWADAPDDVARPLRLIGNRFLEMLLDPDALPLYRIVLAEAGRFPELGRSFYEAGPNHFAAALAEHLSAQVAAGRLIIESPRLAAEQFVGMVLGHFHVRILLGVDGPPDEAERVRAVDQAVALFVSGARPRNEG